MISIGLIRAQGASEYAIVGIQGPPTGSGAYQIQGPRVRVCNPQLSALSWYTYSLKPFYEGIESQNQDVYAVVMFYPSVTYRTYIGCAYGTQGWENELNSSIKTMIMEYQKNTNQSTCTSRWKTRRSL